MEAQRSQFRFPAQCSVPPYFDPNCNASQLLLPRPPRPAPNDGQEQRHATHRMERELRRDLRARAHVRSNARNRDGSAKELRDGEGRARRDEDAPALVPRPREVLGELAVGDPEQEGVRELEGVRLAPGHQRYVRGGLREARRRAAQRYLSTMLFLY